MIEALRRIKLRAMLRWPALSIGAALLLIEIYDACVTPKIDWFWIGLALLQTYIARPERFRGRWLLQR